MQRMTSAVARMAAPALAAQSTLCPLRPSSAAAVPSAGSRRARARAGTHPGTGARRWSRGSRSALVAKACAAAEGDESFLLDGFEVNVKDASWLEGGKAKKAAAPAKAAKAPASPAAKKPAPMKPPLPWCVSGQAGQGWVVVRATRAGRGGKTVTVASGTGLPSDPTQLQSLVKQMKSRLGTGGAVKDGSIEIQGDHAGKVVEALTKLGFKAKQG